MYQSTTLVGHLGGEVEYRYTPGGDMVSSFSLAVRRTWTKDGQKQEKTVWFRISAWRGLAENCAKYLVKGSKVLVVGEIEPARVFTDRDGNARASLEITAQTVRFLSSKQSGDPTDNTTVEGAPDIPF